MSQLSVLEKILMVFAMVVGTGFNIAWWMRAESLKIDCILGVESLALLVIWLMPLLRGEERTKVRLVRVATYTVTAYLLAGAALMFISVG